MASLRHLLALGLALSFPASSFCQGASAAFPVVDGRTQQGRDDLRRQVLTAELASETRLLTQAQERPVTPERERAIQQHASNVDALKREIARLAAGPKPQARPAAPVVVRASRPPAQAPEEPAPEEEAPWWDVYGRKAL